MSLAACGTPPPVPKSPDQALFDAHSAYDAALVVVTNYGAAPLCPGNTWAAGCANGPFLVHAKHASDAAYAALIAAQPLVDAYNALPSPTAGDLAKAQAAVTAAGQEVQAVSALAAQIIATKT
jgi:hypothetical protein